MRKRAVDVSLQEVLMNLQVSCCLPTFYKWTEQMTVYIPKPNKMLLVFCEIGLIPSDKLMLSSSFLSQDSMTPKHLVLFGGFCNKADDLLIKASLGWRQAPSVQACWSDKMLLSCYGF